ncbi:NACHT-domain-containing protein, partial [Tothia fuscella]
MRLLKRDNTGAFSLTEDLVGDDAIPPYAILSHTWVEGQEVTFQDLEECTGGGKRGYDKLWFCAEQAKRDGLQYFWVDTCCIDKSNHAELSREINAMFRRYRDASRCYVYLSDVPYFPPGEHGQLWESAFRKSRWFTRGWTLQELLAPVSVEFFSSIDKQNWEYRRLGDKCSLRQWIHEITDIPHAALGGLRMSQFSIEERLIWIERRQTTKPEDKFYSLLGIFDIKIPLIYGEGAAQAYARLREVIDRQEKCMQDLYVSDPRDDKKRIEDTKGGLLKDSYRWILENPDFRQWHSAQQNPLLWIKGDPGKGKTMLLCGIIDELNKSVNETVLLSYFFCQATDSRINNATAVLRSLIYLLINQRPSLASHLQKKYDQTGKRLFEDANTWAALSEIFTNILQDPSLNTTYLIIDALDECIADLPKLLGFIAQQSTVSSRIKWIVSSRNWPEIEERLDRAERKVKLCLELNAESVSSAVGVYIQHKTEQLTVIKRYDQKTRLAVLQHLVLNANNTFLWVALVCQNLESIQRWETLAQLNTFPPGLDSLYQRMINQIYRSISANLYKQILASTAVVYRPITLKELISLVEIPEDMADDLESMSEIISYCRSFLTVREGIIYFVHQSAKDYLLTDAETVNKVFPSGIGEAHHKILSRSLQVMSRTLRRDMYSLYALGYPIARVKPPDPDPLVMSRYSCIHWVDHLCDWISKSRVQESRDLQDEDTVEVFIRENYLYWLEALSLCRSMSAGVLSMAKFEAFLSASVDMPTLLALVRDGRRFIMAHKLAIENSPLQAYASALLFSPTGSIIKNLFKKEEPEWIILKPAMGDDWSRCLQTLEGHSNLVYSVAFSHD